MAIGKCRECDADVSTAAETCPKCGVSRPVKHKNEHSNSVGSSMVIADRLKVYQSFAELGRKWSQVMDAKAGFLSALNVALLVFIWTGADLPNTPGNTQYFALAATALAFISLLISLLVVYPRTTLKHAFGKKVEYVNDYRAVSFYGYVAGNFPPDKYGEYMAAVDAMDAEAFANEALEQHFTISHIVQKKSDGVALASTFWFMSIVAVIAALFVNV